MRGFGRILGAGGATAAALLGIPGCGPAAEDDDDGSPSPAAHDDDDASVPAPSPPSFVEVGAERGLSRPLSDPEAMHSGAGFGGHTVVMDWDGDGDPDLLFDRLDSAPDLYENDGAGWFTLHEDAVAVAGPGTVFPMLYALGADLDGDGLPELILGGDAALSVYPNLGGLQFGAPSRLWEEPEGNRGASASVHLCDLDGDSDLDLVVPTLGPFPEGPPAGTRGGVDAHPDHVALWDGERWIHETDLFVTDDGSVALAAGCTDVDGDGRLDVLIPADMEFPTAIWRNNGIDKSTEYMGFSDIAPTLGADVRLGGMGLDFADWNGDGRLDFCISNTGRVWCLESEPGGGFVEAGQARGLVVDEPLGVFGTVGWALAFADIDRDGRPELLQGSGPFSYEGNASDVEAYPSLLFSQREDGQFVDWTEESGLDVAGDHPGVATGDVDGDHCTDVVFAGPLEPPRLFLGQCDGGHWLEVDTDGAPGQPTPFGLRVEVVAGGRTQVRQRSSLLGAGQSDGVLLFGLGAATSVDSLRLTWPDGREELWEELAADQRVGGQD
jgi:hypothetical protein